MKLFRQLFLHNLGLKFFSVILAFAIWRTITSEDIAEVGFTAPLELRNIPAGVELVGDVVNSVNLRVRSSSRLLKRLSSADMYVSIDLAHASLGEHTYPLSSANVQAPVGVDVVRVVPTHVKLRLERTVRRTVPVSIRWRGQTSDQPPQYLKLSPSRVSVEGPESRVNAISQVYTDPVSLKDLSPGQSYSINLSVDDPTLRLSIEKVTIHWETPAKPLPADKNRR